MKQYHRSSPLRQFAALRSSRSERGAALMFALAAVLIITFLIFGVTQLCTQDFSLANTQRDSALALNAAEAALNWELTKLTRLGYDNGVQIDQRSNPYVGALPSTQNGLGGPKVAGATTIQGTVRVYVTDGSGQNNWAPPGPAQIYATGTVNGVSRSVNTWARPISAGENYLLYGVHSLSLSGGSVALQGFLGTAGGCSVSATGTLNGTVLFDGDGAWSGGHPNWDWLATGMAGMMPTVDTIIARAAFTWLNPNGGNLAVPITDTPVEFFKQRSDNNTWLMARYASHSALVPVLWPDSDTEHVRIDQALYDANDQSHRPPGYGELKAIVLVGNGTRLPNNVPIGSNFYFEHIVLPAHQTLEIQNDARDMVNNAWGGYGPVRVWLGPGLRNPGNGGSFDLLAGTLLVDDGRTTGAEADSTYFTVYNATGTPIRMGGSEFDPKDANNNPGFYGVIYSYNTDGAGGYGTVQIADSLSLRGSIVAWDIRQTAGSLSARFSSNMGQLPEILKYVLYYRTDTQWRETNSQGAAQTPASQTGFW